MHLGELRVGKAIRFVATFLGVGSVTVSAAIYYVNGTTGNDSYDGQAAVWNGVHGPKRTIQAANNLAAGGDTVQLADGVYSGASNVNLSFPDGIIIQSENGPSNTVIDCRNEGTVYYAWTIYATLRGLTFMNATNYAIASNGDGYSGYLTLESCNFVSNRFGALLMCGVEVTITNCYFYSNQSSNSAPIVVTGGAFGDGWLTILNSTFKENSCFGYDSVLYSQYLPIDIESCTFISNFSARHGGAVSLEMAQGGLLVSNCVFRSNVASRDGGAFYIGMSSDGYRIMDCEFRSNIASNGGAFAVSDHLPIHVPFSNCTFWGNRAVSNGGAIAACFIDLANCLIVSNSASGQGGALMTRFYYAPARIKWESINLLSCTLVFNSSAGGQGIIYTDSTNTMVNCIYWGNVSSPSSNIVYGSGASVSYSDIEGGWTGEGTNNINVDPQFVDPANGDFHLKSRAGHWTTNGWVSDAIWSPCIDAGDPSSDYSNEPMPNGGRVNMGAYGNTPQASKSPPGWASLIITGQPPAYAVSSPYGYGTNRVGITDVITNTVSAVTSPTNNTRWVCTGWNGTGDVPSSGNTNVVVVTVSTNSTLGWQWKTQYWLHTGVNGSGSVDVADSWWNQGTNVGITATAMQYYHFGQWSGDVSASQTNSNPLSLLMDQPRSVIASFLANLATNSVPQWWLASFGLTTPTWDAAALADQDGDGMAAWQEYRAGTDPTNSMSILRITSGAATGANFVVRFPTVAGKSYDVLWINALSGGSWSNLVTGIPGTGGTVSVTDTNALLQPRRFYRIQLITP